MQGKLRWGRAYQEFYLGSNIIGHSEVGGLAGGNEGKLERRESY